MRRWFVLALCSLACASCWNARPPTTVATIVDEPPEDSVKVGYFFFHQCGNAGELTTFAQARGADYIILHHFLGSSTICNVALYAIGDRDPK